MLQFAWFCATFHITVCAAVIAAGTAIFSGFPAFTCGSRGSSALMGILNRLSPNGSRGPIRLPNGLLAYLSLQP